LLLCGDKRTQDDDIEAARKHWADYKTRKAADPSQEGQPRPPPLLRHTNKE
jgi:hypothetical protein